MKTFVAWCVKSIYQGAVIMIGAVLLFEDNFVNIVSITFSALILIEILWILAVQEVIPVKTQPVIWFLQMEI